MNSYVPNRYKQNLVWPLLHLGFSICNSSQLRKKEFHKIQTFSRKLDFPLKLHKQANPTLSYQKAVEKTQNRQEGRHKTDFHKTSLHKRNERPYTERN